MPVPATLDPIWPSPQAVNQWIATQLHAAEFAAGDRTNYPKDTATYPLPRLR